MTAELIAIDKVAKDSGFAASALRYYERLGLIEEGTKIGGRRHYPATVLDRLAMIRACQSVGFSLTEIAALLDGEQEPGGSWRELAAQRRDDIEREIELRRSWLNTLDSTLACGCPRLETCPLEVAEGKSCPLIVPATRAAREAAEPTEGDRRASSRR